MNIVHFLDEVRLEAGGVARAVIDLCSALASRDIGVTLITYDPADAPRHWAQSASVKIIRIAKRPALARPFGQVPREIDAAIGSADALHLHTPWEPLNPALARCAIRRGVPYVVSIHGMLDDWSMRQAAMKKRLYHAILARPLLRRASAIHCTAAGELQQASRWFAGADGVVVPLLMDLEPFRVLPGPGLALSSFPFLRPDAPRLLFLSRLHVKKGVERLLEASSLLRSEGVDCDVVIAGAGEEAYVQSLRGLATSLSLDERTHFVGHVGGNLKFSLYECADVFVLPTSQENFGLVLPEALACATPVVTTKGVDIWPELESSGGAVIAPPTGPGLADALRPLLSDELRRRDMGRRGRAWVLERLAPQAIIGQYEDIYRRVLAGARRARA